MKIAIVDDEIVYTTYLEEIIKSLCLTPLPKIVLDPQIETFESGTELLSSGHVFDLIFLDIYMEGSSGIEIADVISKKSPSTLIVFQTSSSDHYADAFHSHAFEYLVKPYSAEAIEKILKEAIERIPSVPSSITINVDKLDIAILLDNIISIESDGHYLNFNLDGKPSERTRMTIAQVTEMLQNDPRFVMCSRGIIVNLDFMETYNKEMITLKNGISYPIQAANNKEILKKILEYIHS